MSAAQAGIVACGTYLPLRRLPLSVLGGGTAEGGPERTVAWADEDSVTLAVEAARDCLRGRSRERIDLLLFATTTYAFSEKQGAVLIAAALGLPPQVRTVDIGNSLRAGSHALSAAIDAVSSGRAREALVVVADCRMGAPGSDLERSAGDAGVAFLISAKEPCAVFVGATYAGEELVDVWRRAGERFTHSWEDRFVTRHGYLDPAGAAAQALRERHVDRDPASWSWAASAPNARALGSLAASLGLERRSLHSGFHDRVGFTGAAHGPLLLTDLLERARPGDRVALLTHGDGAEALLFEVLRPTPRSGLQAALERRLPVARLDAYRRARELEPTEYPPADDQGISATVHFRERDADLRLQGQRCACGEPQFPKGRVCFRCGRKDAFTPEDYAERGGTVVTYTLDAFFPSPDPPTAVGIIQVEEGPRIYLQIADIPAREVAIGLPVQFAFRCIHRAGRRPNYFWKAVPRRSTP